MIIMQLLRIVLLVSAVGAVCLPSAQAAEPIRLITVEEARLPAAGAASSPERNLTRGPGIDRLAPPAIGLDGPFRFAVKFKPRNSVPVDPASVRVTYRRQPAVDLTPRVKAFLTADGIDAPAVIVPPGRHIIEIEATDKEGRLGRGQVTLTVEAPK
ncbi:MAG TPA: hypothetical protein VGV17_11925 [Bosea sp. (in: a-proteobacteria)]|uniref:hypothetical protein n=1 Tax=Bosea sp. (in: a-proteobacteria) TaxID=1871050 RepID=UPI002DDD73D2|nr:hypothetical protein [Bosea sp. (in: a-proteobacteria)]HEV2554456.1 hypothetical protein [Bosea sp. (in: a-proteobacteria)]